MKSRNKSERSKAFNASGVVEGVLKSAKSAHDFLGMPATDRGTKGSEVVMVEAVDMGGGWMHVNIVPMNLNAYKTLTGEKKKHEKTTRRKKK